MIVANSLNIVLGPMLIFGIGPFPELGVTGAAIATTIGRGIGLVMAFWMLARGAGHPVVKHAHLAVEPVTMWRIARLSGMGTVQVAIGSMSWMGLVRIVSSYGATAMAGYTIAIRLVIFALMPAFGLGGAAGMVFEQSFNGAGDTWTPTWLNLLTFRIIQIPLAGVLFRGGRWKLKYV